MKIRVAPRPVAHTPHPEAEAVRATFARIQLLMGNKTALAFEAGQLLLEAQAKHSHEILGLNSFQDLLDEMKLRVSTAYSNMAVATHFNFHAHGHLGIGKLRLLAGEYFPERHQYIDEGLPVQRPDGSLQILKVETATYRELREALKLHKVTLKGATGRQVDPRTLEAVAAFKAG